MRFAHPRFQPAPLALALALALAAPAVTLAQAATDAAAAVTLSLAAQPLDAALNALSAATGTPIGFSPAVVAGKTARAVTGTFTVRQAVDQLLAGSGLIAVQDANGIVIKVAERAGDVATLAPVTVMASTERDITSEGTGSYAARGVSIMKGAQSLKEIPQAVSVITRQQLDDQGLTSVEDVFTQLPGARIDGYTGTMRVFSRGYRTNTQMDGVPEQQVEGGTNFKLDPAIYDRVEMLRGPSGLVSGSGELGGTINLVRKRPHEAYALSGNVSYGSWSHVRTDIDVTGPLNEAGTLRGRAVGVFQDQDQFYDVAHARRKLAYGVLEYDITPGGTLGLSVTHMEDSNNLIYGFPRYLDGTLPERTRFVGAERPLVTKVSDVTVDYRHRFDNSWQAKAMYSYRKEDYNWASAYALQAIDPQTGRTDVLGVNFERAARFHSLDVNVSGPFALFGRTHQATLGYNSARKEEVTPRRFNSLFPDADILNTHYWGAPSDLRPYGNAYGIEQSGIYGSVNYRLLDPLAMVLGGRFSSYKYRSRNNDASPWVTSDARVKHEFTPYAGLVFDVNEQVAVYGSYAEIFVPQSSRDYTGSVLKPRTGEQYELGVKSELLDGRLNASLAVYQMRDKNRSMEDTDRTHICPENANQRCLRAAGQIQSRGVELELSGTPTPGWNLSASYAFNRSKYLSDTNPANIGKTPTAYANPRHLFKVWTQYDLGHSGFKSLSGWTVGGGVIAQSALSNACPYVPGGVCSQSAYAIASAKVGYRFNRNLQVSFDVDNIFDRTYLTNLGDDTYYNIYGKPRSYRLNLSYRFD